MKTRLSQLRSRFDALKIDAFLVTFGPHLRYMSGFSGSAGIGVIGASGAYLITDGRYASQVREEAPGWKIIIAPGGLFEALADKRILPHGVRIGFDGNTILYTQYRQIRKLFPKVKFLPKVDVIEPIAAVKDRHEIEKIKRAVKVTDTVFSELLPLIRPGVRELDLAAEISYRQRMHGAEADAFESIVASGPRSALPHGRATSRAIGKGELLTLDFGAVVDGYHSDMTRTVAVGKVPAEAKKIYGIVLEAQKRAIGAAQSGVKTSDLDGVARVHIRKSGYDKYYRHSLGHGIGLQIHEAPRISVLSKAALAAGNVVTIEPGIYVPDLGGVRIEDDILVGDNGSEVLTGSPKELMTL